MQRIVMFFAMFVATCSFRLFAGDEGPFTDWGDVSVDQLKLTSFPADSNATAVVLFDIGDVTFDAHYDIIYKRHTRIKILTKAGFELATHKFSYYTKDHTQSVDDIEGQTVFLTADGRVETKELDDDEIFDEKSGEDWQQVKFTLPSLTPGCVIEYRYTIRSSNAHYMPDWEFQTSEPTLWSEFKVKSPPVFNYASVSLGYEPFYIKTVITEKETFMAGSRIEIMDVSLQRFVIKDAPAIRDEPYITTLDDYKSRLTFQLAAVNWPGDIGRRILESWEKVAEELNDHPKFGKQLSGFSDVRTQTEAITAGILDPLKKMEAVYDFVRRTIVWNERRRFLATDNLDDVLESKTGSSADVNLLLTLMLRHAGLSANPVLLSTRGNGKVQTLYPIVSQFDYVICKVDVGKQEFLLDATDRYRPFSLLSQRALNHTGFLLKDERYAWIPVEPSTKGRYATSVVASIAEDGSLKGQVQMGFFDFNASYERSRLAGKKPDEYVKGLLSSETSGIAVDSFSIHDKDSVGATFRVEAQISSPSYGQAINEFLYLNPTIVDRSSDNPFKLEKRTFPVDFAYPFSGTYVANIRFPEGYTLKDPPNSINIRLPRNGGTFTRLIKAEGDLLQLSERFDIKQVLFEPHEYPVLRKFYEQIVASENEQVMLQKIAVPPPPPRDIKPTTKKKK